jgi:hypothetical protein
MFAWSATAFYAVLINNVIYIRRLEPPPEEDLKAALTWISISTAKSYKKNAATENKNTLERKKKST